MAFLADIAILEVALRNSMHEAAAAVWGSHWYASINVPLDDRTSNNLNRAWGHLHASVRNRPDDPDVPGRLIAQCMFGFWTNLLDAGSYVGKEPRRYEVDYEALWLQAFKSAFPGGRAEARAQRHTTSASVPNFTREWTHSVCKTVNELRNRVAHHEPIINGFPLNGQRARKSAAEGHDVCMTLARMIDRDLGKWLSMNSTVPGMLASRPC